MRKPFTSRNRLSGTVLAAFHAVCDASAALAASCALGAEAGGEVRYLAAAGDDAADGKTPATAWRTIERANAALPAGATLRLKCGDTFYGGLMLPSGPDAAHPTVLTSWGEGPKPVISATKNLKSDPSGWQDLTHCRWRINIANPSNFTGIVPDLREFAIPEADIANYSAYVANLAAR